MAKPEELVSDSKLNKKLLVKHMREDNLMIRFILFPEVKTKGVPLTCISYEHFCVFSYFYQR